MKKYLCLFCLYLFCVGCMDDEIRRPVASGTSGEEDTENHFFANLPVHIDSTGYLIHPVGKIEQRKRSYGSSSHISGSRAFGDGFSGNFLNLKFQEINSEALTKLTDKDIRVQSVLFLWEIFNNTGKQLLLYNIIDSDLNADEKLNSEDLQSLYMSGIDGGNFRKLSPSNRVVLDYQIVAALNRLYFRSLEDVNDNGEPDAEEKLSYFYVDLASEALTVTEYFPVGA